MHGFNDHMRRYPGRSEKFKARNSLLRAEAREAEKLTKNANRVTRERALEQCLSDLTLPALLVKSKSV